MPEPAFLTVRCPSCGVSSDRVPASLAGRTVRCPRCASRFAVPVAAPEPAPTRPDEEEPAPTVAEGAARRPDGRGFRGRSDRPSPRTALSPPPGRKGPPPGTVSAADAWQPGDVVLGLYEVKGVLGQGGMGRVYRVRHRGWALDLAVKAPLPSVLEAAGGADLFEREAETWVSLGLHPHVVTCHYVRRIARAAARLRRVRGRREPARRHPGAAPRFRRVAPRRRDPVRVGPPLRPRAGPRSPRREAGERHADVGRHRQGHGLRPRAGPLGPGAGSRGGRVRPHDDRGGRGRRDSRLRLARAGRGPAGQPPRRPLELRSVRSRGLPRRANVGVRPRGDGGARRLPPRRAHRRRTSGDARARRRSPGPLLPRAARGPAPRPRRGRRRPARRVGDGSPAGRTRARSRRAARAPPTPSTTARSRSWTSGAPPRPGRSGAAPSRPRPSTWRRPTTPASPPGPGAACRTRSSSGGWRRPAHPTPRCARAQLLLGRVHIALGQPAEALTALERATALGGAEGIDEDMAAARAGMPPPLRTLRGLPGPVAALALSPDGRTVAAGSGGEVRVWDAGTGQLLRTIPIAGGPGARARPPARRAFPRGGSRERSARPLGPGLRPTRAVLGAARRLRDEPRRACPAVASSSPAARTGSSACGTRRAGAWSARCPGTKTPSPPWRPARRTSSPRAGTARCGSGPSRTDSASARSADTRGASSASPSTRRRRASSPRGKTAPCATGGSAPASASRSFVSHGQAVAAVALVPGRRADPLGLRRPHGAGFRGRAGRLAPPPGRRGPGDGGGRRRDALGRPRHDGERPARRAASTCHRRRSAVRPRPPRRRPAPPRSRRGSKRPACP